ncbi:DUF637 domain-containing protein, partial [Pandoraea sp. NPDC087047]|uniref:DUF637 domain-containing protein n=1 Tax=Pandoraea sp. NPDC087047 TaxID=3364390 RepID=UPI0038289B02
NNFDKAQIETSFEIMQTLQREVGTFVGNRAKEAEAIETQLKKTTDPEQLASLNQQLAEAKKWGPGGDYRLIVSAITAGISGNVTGATGEMATRATVNYLQGLAAKEIKTLGEKLDPTSKAALHAITGCAGGAASSGNCNAGAMGAAAGSLLGSLLATGDKPGHDLSQSEREARVNLITSIVAGVTASVGGDVATASTSAKTEAENNTLGIVIAPPAPPQTGGPLRPRNGTRDGRDSGGLDPTVAGSAGTASEGKSVADRLKSALTKATCAISGFACSNQLIVEGVVARVIGDVANDDDVMGTPNNGPRGATVTGTPDTGEKGPTITGTPDQGERGATIVSTPDKGVKGPNVIATPNNGPLVSDPLLDKLHIKDHYDHHMDIANDIKKQLTELGYRVSNKEISFGDSCGSGRCRPDIVVESPDGELRIIEIKTGDAKLTKRQSEIFPQIIDGTAIPRGSVAEIFGFDSSKPLTEQNLPNGIKIEIIRFPGAKNE